MSDGAKTAVSDERTTAGPTKAEPKASSPDWAEVVATLLLLLPGLALVLFQWNRGAVAGASDRLLFVGATLAAAAPLTRHWLNQLHREAMLREVRYAQEGATSTLDEQTRRIGRALEDVRNLTLRRLNEEWAKEHRERMTEIQRGVDQLKELLQQRATGGIKP